MEGRDLPAVRALLYRRYGNNHEAERHDATPFMELYESAEHVASLRDHPGWVYAAGIARELRDSQVSALADSIRPLSVEEYALRQGFLRGVRLMLDVVETVPAYAREAEESANRVVAESAA